MPCKLPSSILKHSTNSYSRERPLKARLRTNGIKLMTSNGSKRNQALTGVCFLRTSGWKRKCGPKLCQEDQELDLKMCSRRLAWRRLRESIVVRGCLAFNCDSEFAPYNPWISHSGEVCLVWLFYDSLILSIVLLAVSRVDILIIQIVHIIIFLPAWALPFGTFDNRYHRRYLIVKSLFVSQSEILTWSVCS